MTPPIARRLRCSTLRCGALLPLLLLPLPVLAWNAAGHRLVACIAWDDLDQRSRAQLASLLREHPDYRRWQKRAEEQGAAADRASFIEASTWPDEIRQDSRFYSAGIDAPTPTLPGFPDMERRRDWHYVNRPLPAAAADAVRRPTQAEAGPGQLDKQLPALAQTLGSADAAARSYALPWLIHLTGDAHQPLHTSLRVDREGRVDRLGTGLSVINPFNPRRMSTTLHAYWDDLPGPAWLRGERLDAACRSLAALYPRPAPSSAGQWLDESWEIARTSGYPPGDEAVPTISAEFDENARQIARRRIAQAGYRLAELLRGVLGGR